MVSFIQYQGLVQQSMLSGGALESAARQAHAQGRELEDVLVRDCGVALQQVGAALALFFGVPYEPYRPARIKPALLLKHLKAQYVDEHQWLPLDEDHGGLLVMALDPERARASRIISQVFPKSTVTFCVTTRREFKHTMDQFFGTTARSDGSSLREVLSNMAPDSTLPAATAAEAVDNELVRLVNKVIMDAYRQGASDIHIEPLPGVGRIGIRFRKDGLLVPYTDVPASYRSALVARVKIMCDLDTSERRKPQDGKISFGKYAPLDIELRVATIPSTGGVEDVVLRILTAGAPVPLEELGMLPHNLARLRCAIDKPHGLFFVCGPTGSGKTTTLHSVLSHLNTPETKIWTAEDPVEITQKGLRQVQVNRKAGLDFATVMRAFLRADPDVIMVGEMRDRETVSIGIEASLTGHLVLATLHTNSAPESIVRLLDMGMDPFNFSDALLGVLAQRLARRLCGHCKVAYEPDDAELMQMAADWGAEGGGGGEGGRGSEGGGGGGGGGGGKDAKDAKDPKGGEGAERAGNASGVNGARVARWRAQHGDSAARITLYRASGCDECNKGYRGRLALHELMLGTERIRTLLQERARVSVLLAAALGEGMQTLKMDGICKVLMGMTDMRSVRQVCFK